MDDWVSKMFEMWYGSWLAPFGEKEIGSGRGGSMTGKSVEGILGDEVRDLDVVRWVFVHWNGRYGDDNAVIIVIGEGQRRRGRCVVAVVFRGRRVWLDWSRWGH